MIFLDNLNSISVFNNQGPFGALDSIKWRASQILKNRSQDKQAEAADQLAWAIAAFTDELIDEEMSQYVERLYQHGGWELGFWEGSESGISPTRDDLIELLNHWPARADDQPKLPSAADFPEFEVLRDIVDREFLFSIGETPLISATEYFALLALIKLGQAAGSAADPLLHIAAESARRLRRCASWRNHSTCWHGVT